MNEAKELEGIDFDWFAFDIEGNIGIFATVGRGAVPVDVLNSVEMHEKISSELHTPNWGNDAIWDDYAKSGLYVFDRRDESYARIRSPVVNARFVAKDAEKIPRLRFSFKVKSEVYANDF